MNGVTVPRLTIGLPVYNGEHYLAESLDALLGQTYQDFRLIILDNASTDGTGAVARRYEQLDPRVSYRRQPVNVGAARNHMQLVQECTTELFKWASADDLYARDNVERCVELLDRTPDAVLAHCWTAAVDGDGKLTQARPYPLKTDSPDPAVRMGSMLFGAAYGDGSGEEAADQQHVISADDCYGIVRTEVMQRVRPHDSYYYADRTFMTELALNGRFVQVPDWLYFRRDHPDRAQHANPSIRSRCVNLDPRRANRWRHPTVRLLAGYLLGYVGAVRRAPLSAVDRRRCMVMLGRWLLGRGSTALELVGLRRRSPGSAVLPALPAIPVDELVPGRARAHGEA